MTNVTFITMKNSSNQEIEYAVIDKGNGEFTSMLKADYDAAQVAPQA